MLALLVLLSLPPESIGPPAPGLFTRDLTGTLSQRTVSQLEAMANRVDASGQGQLGVAVIHTTDGMVPRTFATRLFNHWGIGHSPANDGLLLFIALDDHKAEIIIGDGLRGSRVTTAQTDRIMAAVVQHFKAHDVDGAVLAGAEQLSKLLSTDTAAPTHVGMPPQMLDETMRNGAIRPEEHGLSATPTPSLAAAIDARLAARDTKGWVLDLTGLPHSFPELERAGDGVYAQGQRRLFFVVTVMNQGALVEGLADEAQQRLGENAVVVAFDPNGSAVAAAGSQLDRTRPAIARQVTELARAVQASAWADVASSALTLVDWSVHGLPRRSADEAVHDVMQGCGATVFAWPVALLFGGIFGFRRWNRYRSRTCECGRPRQRLGAVAEKQYLSDSQRQEENLGSVDYDVWWCALCKNVWINDNVAWFSGYSRCPQCSARTRTSSTTTLTYASEYSGGLEQIAESCQSCSYRNTYTRMTARLSSSSSSDSSSSSSSDSFGGGSSSGDGSSGSW